MRALLFGAKHKIRVETVLDKKQMLFWRKMKNTDRKIDIKTMLFFLFFCFAPPALFSLCDPRERAMLIDACAKNNVGAVFSGHDHYGSRFDYGAFVEYGVYSYVNNRNWQDGSFGILSVDEENARFNYTQH
jgi:hypothetical protein